MQVDYDESTTRRIAMMASLLTYPHEVIRSRMMDARNIDNVQFRATCRAIFRQDGISGFYAGLPVSLLRVIPNTCLTFVTYELVLRWSRQQFGGTTTDGADAAIKVLPQSMDLFD